MKTKRGIGIVGKTRFHVPETYNCLEILFSIKKLKEIPFLIQLTLLITMITTFLCTNVSKHYFLGIFLFWRICYNIGLGGMLHFQSKNQTITRFFKNYIVPSTILCAWFEDNVSTKNPKDDGKILEKYPVEFSSWLFFRAFVDIILACDTFSYLIFVAAFCHVPTSASEISTTQWGLYAFGLGLVLFNIWVKIDSHRVIGEFAWFWGDFFFLVEKQLTFDGVFQMFPHPMYTVGYSYYYGLALLSKSHTVLYASAFSHMSQLLFLYFVETPHIDKIYSTKPTQEELDQHRILYDELKYFRRSGEPLTYYKFDLTRTSDLTLLLLSFYVVVIGYLVEDIRMHFCHAVIWRLFHSVYLSLILYYQSHYRTWTQSFIQNGASKKESFLSWKTLYNTSLTMNNVVFVVLFFKIYNFNNIFYEYQSNAFLVKHLFGVVLIYLNYYASFSVNSTLGDMGWYYADFFLNDIPVKLNYTGLYRYLNDPYLIFGYGLFYGLALMASSWYLFYFALFSQISHFVFNLVVERPHMKKLYGNKVVRRQGGLFTNLGKGIGIFDY